MFILNIFKGKCIVESTETMKKNKYMRNKSRLQIKFIGVELHLLEAILYIFTLYFEANIVFKHFPKVHFILNIYSKSVYAKNM